MHAGTNAPSVTEMQAVYAAAALECIAGGIDRNAILVRPKFGLPTSLHPSIVAVLFLPFMNQTQQSLISVFMCVR